MNTTPSIQDLQLVSGCPRHRQYSHFLSNTRFSVLTGGADTLDSTEMPLFGLLVLRGIRLSTVYFM